ncbi:cobaltochelatase subunit CobN [Methanothermobacter marburgensis]|nr:MULTISPECIES: cobaltochelatase subunit CobN [Methanothermobacter]WBF10578.1 cobaltochelatase subunit CobN [Methanothermobacter marburgensis]
MAQERDNVEYEVTDLDHYYEFMGGLTSSIRSLGGSCSVRVVDSTEDELYVEGLEDVIGRAVRCRILNPRWLYGCWPMIITGQRTSRTVWSTSWASQPQQGPWRTGI